MDTYLPSPALPHDPSRLPVHPGTDAETLSPMTLRLCRDAVRVALLMMLDAVQDRSRLERSEGFEWWSGVQYL